MSGIQLISSFLDEKSRKKLKSELRKKLVTSIFEILKNYLGKNVSKDVLHLQDLERVFSKVRTDFVIGFTDLKPYELSLLLASLGIGLENYCFGEINDEVIADIINKILWLQSDDVAITGLIKPFDRLIVTDVEILVRDNDMFDYVHDEIYVDLDSYDLIYCMYEQISDDKGVFRCGYSPPIELCDF
ncbi:MAG: hypothetical protein GXO43_09785 [Crenarchaeota archaeon]|nr:hypothetical protein [Thermoproteota archaeon]